MKTISTKPSIKKPTIKMPDKPNAGMRMPKLPGMVNPLRLKR